MDLTIDQDAFRWASKELEGKRKELKELSDTLQASFEQLKMDWDSDAGRQFFVRFENDLISNLKKYSDVFEYMSKNLSIASEKYEEVFRAAEAVVKAQY